MSFKEVYMFAQFSDSTKTTIVAIFDAEPSLETAPYQEEITASDSRYKTFYDSVGERVQGFLLTPIT